MFTVKEFERKKQIENYRKSILKYAVIPVPTIIKSDLVICKEIQEVIKNDIALFEKFFSYEEGIKIEEFIFPSADNNIVEPESGKLPSNIANSCFCNALLFCMFWYNIAYHRLLNFYCESEEMYNMVMNDKYYRYDLYSKTRGILSLVVNTLYGYGNDEKSDININETIESFRKEFREFRSSELYGQQDDASQFYNRLVTLLDYTKKYDIYIKNTFIWKFIYPLEWGNLSNQERHDIESHRTGAGVYQYIDDPVIENFVLTSNFKSLGEYLSYISGKSVPILYEDISKYNYFSTKLLRVQHTEIHRGIKCTQEIVPLYTKLPDIITISVNRYAHEKPLIFTRDELDIPFALPFKTCEGDELHKDYRISGIIYLIHNHYVAETFVTGLWTYFNDAGSQTRTRSTDKMIQEHNDHSHHVRLLFAKAIQ